MTYQLQPGLLPVNGQLIETYSRDSRASDETKQSLGLPIDQPIKANIGISSVEEYIILQASAIPKNDSRYWILNDLNQAIALESIYVDAPQADKFEFEILTLEGNTIFKLVLNRNQTPYDLPAAPLPSDLVVKIKATTNINLLRIICKPVVILDYIIGVDNVTFPIVTGS